MLRDDRTSGFAQIGAGGSLETCLAERPLLCPRARGSCGVGAQDELAMPYLIYIGANEANRAGTSSKGYWIYRRGFDVVARWGPIDSMGARGARFRWRHHQEQRWSFRTTAEANDFVNE